MSQLTEGHLLKRYDAELQQLHHAVLEMGGLVLAQVRDAVRSLRTGDVDLANAVIRRDDKVDALEVDSDTRIIALCARRCPMGGDLRLVMSLSKSVTDLERIGDEAVKIASSVKRLFASDRPRPADSFLLDVLALADVVVNRLEEALQIIDRWDAEAAQRFIASQHEVSDRFPRTLTRIMDNGRGEGGRTSDAVNLVLILRALERVSGHAENLTEYVIYQVMGLVLRHHAV